MTNEIINVRAKEPKGFIDFHSVSDGASGSAPFAFDFFLLAVRRGAFRRAIVVESKEGEPGVITKPELQSDQLLPPRL